MSDTRISRYVFFVAMALVGAIFFVPIWNAMPRGVHAWAQSDRLAQAYGYFYNGFQLSKPMLMTPGPCTGEFPVLGYWAAIFGRFWGVEAIHVAYRVTLILLATLGWSAVAYSVFRKTHWWVGAFFAAVLVYTCPFLVFFSHTFIQDAASLGVLLLGASVFWRSKKSATAPAYLALVLLTLAALIKTTSTTFLIATALTQLFLWRKTGFRKWLPYLLAFAVSLGLIFLHLVWMKNYNQIHGCGIFIAKPMPFKLGLNLLHELGLVYKTNEWFLGSQMHKIVFPILAILAILGAVMRCFPRYFVLHFFLVLGGAFGFFWQMGQQFMIHTYYFLCSFVPVFVMLAAGGIITLHHLFTQKRAINIVLLAILALSTVQSKRIFQTVDQNPIEDAWAMKAEIPTDFVVPAEAYVLYVTASYAPNFPQLFFRRKGIVFSRDDIFAKPDLLLEHNRLYGSKYVIIGLDDAAKLLANPVFVDKTTVLYRGNSYLLLGFR